MASKDDKTTKPAFEVRVPDDRTSHAGITFAGGVGHTDDPIRAHACLEIGATVTKHGKPWPEPAGPATSH